MTCPRTLPWKPQRIQCGLNPWPLDYESNTSPLSHTGPLLICYWEYLFFLWKNQNIFQIMDITSKTGITRALVFNKYGLLYWGFNQNPVWLGFFGHWGKFFCIKKRNYRTIIHHFYASVSKGWGHVVLLVSVFLSVHLSICLSKIYHKNFTFPCHSKTIQAIKFMFVMRVCVIDAHLMRVIFQRSRSNSLKLNNQMNRAFSKIVLLQGHGITNASFLLILMIDISTTEKLEMNIPSQ